MHIKEHKRFIGLLLMTLVVDGLFFGLSNPVSAPSIFLIIGYVLAVLTLGIVVHLVLAVVNLYIPGKRRISPQISQLVTVVLAIILAMQSIGQLSFHDLLAFLPIVLIGSFYVSYNRKRPAERA